MKRNFVSFDSNDIVKPKEARETQYIGANIPKLQTVRKVSPVNDALEQVPRHGLLLVLRF